MPDLADIPPAESERQRAVARARWSHDPAGLAARVAVLERRATALTPELRARLARVVCVAAGVAS